MNPRTGVPSQLTDDPNNPSYDPATCLDRTTKKIMWLCENAWNTMSPWEQNFCKKLYGRSPMTPTEHRKVAEIYLFHKGRTPLP